jgi:adenylate kinase
MKSIIFIAPPAAGKGTQSDMLTAKYNIPHISTGLLLRNEVVNGGKYSEYISEQMHLGNLVNDDIILELLSERLSHSDCDNGYILDGFPRDIEQAIAYDKILKNLNKELGYVIVLDLDKDTALKRIIGRLTCSNCGIVYNDMFDDTKPKHLGVCNECNSELTKRDDDTEEIFNNRYQTYLNTTEPLIKYYEAKGVLYRIDSGINKEYTFSQIEKIINKGE